MARADEMPLAIVVRIRAAKVGARERERAQRPVVAGQVAGERRIAGSVPFTAIGHHECHPGGRGKSRDPAFFERAHRRVQCDPNRLFLLVRIARRKDVDRDRRERGDDSGRQDRCHPPGKKSPPSWLLWWLDSHYACKYGTALQAEANAAICARMAALANGDAAICARMAGVSL